MTDLISRSAAMNALSDVFGIPLDYDGECNEMCDEAFAAIEALPAVDAVPVVHAHWIGMEYDGYADGYPVFDTWGCSACGEEYCSEGDPPVCNYRPNCGAQMDEKEND